MTALYELLKQLFLRRWTISGILYIVKYGWYNQMSKTVKNDRLIFGKLSDFRNTLLVLKAIFIFEWKICDIKMQPVFCVLLPQEEKTKVFILGGIEQNWLTTLLPVNSRS